jgi:hypothetical protein
MTEQENTTSILDNANSMENTTITVDNGFSMENITSILDKYSFDLDAETIRKISGVLMYISSSSGGNITIYENIKNQINEIIADGKIDIYDSISIVRIIIDILNVSNIVNVFTGLNLFDVKNVVKIILYSFIESNIITTSNISSLLNTIVDNSSNVVESYFILPTDPTKKSCWQTFLEYLAKLGIKF